MTSMKWPNLVLAWPFYQHIVYSTVIESDNMDHSAEPFKNTLSLGKLWGVFRENGVPSNL